MTPDPAYVATHHDPLTAHLREFCWRPTSTYTCGCHPSALCAQHTEIRAVEQSDPRTQGHDDDGLDLILRPNGAGPLYDTCDMPIGPDGATCMLPGDHRNGCLARPSHGPRSANDPIEGAA